MASACAPVAPTRALRWSHPHLHTLFVLQFIIAFGPGVASNSIRVGNLLGEGRRTMPFCAGVAWGVGEHQCSLVAFVLTFRTDRLALRRRPEVLAHSVMRLTTVYSFFATMAPGWS